MSGVLVLGIVLSIIAILDALAEVFGGDTRPDFGIGHTVLG